VRPLRAIFVLALLPTLASADVVSYTGSTTGQPTFRRPLAGTPPLQLSPVGTAVCFEALAFQVSEPGAYTLVITTASSGYDAFMHLYAPGFNPLLPLAGCMTGDDDAGPGSNPSITMNLVPGSSSIAVISGFQNTDFGAYTLEIRGPGKITLIPAPASLALLALPALAPRRRR